MEIQGKIIAILPTRSGVSAKGTQWQVSEYVLETQEQYPQRMSFDVFGADNAAQFNIREGEELKVYFNFNAHEYQGRWFNQIRAWKVERPNAGQALQPAPQQSAFPSVVAQASTSQETQSSDDLPF